MRCLAGLVTTCDPMRTQIIATDDSSPEYNLTEQPLPPNVPALCRARMIHEYPLIQDVERIEKLIGELPV